jgi:hypothetical protein
MKNPQLKLTDLVLGLERFGQRYDAIDVFADDLLELQSEEPVPGLYSLDTDGKRFRYSAPSGATYDVDLLPDAGIVRLSRAKHPGAEPVQSGLVGAWLGATAGTAVDNALSKKGQGAAAGIILGLLAGAVFGDILQPNAPRRVFTLRFDPSLGQWRAYDGGLVPWMKENLLPQSA